MDTIQFITVPCIVSVVYAALTLLKQSVKPTSKVMNFLPFIATTFGVALGILIFYGMPEIIPANNVFTAVIIGGASGLAATGTHQAIKQIGKISTDNTDTPQSDTAAEVQKTDGDSNENPSGDSGNQINK